MAKTTSFQDCARCKGTGKSLELIDSANPSLGTEDKICINCNGDGFIKWGDLDVTEIMTDLDKCKRRLKKIMDKLEIND